MHASPPETRASLILRLQDAGDVAAWEEFVDIYSPVVFRVAIGRGFQAADAENIVQEVLLAVARSVEQWLQRTDRRSADGRTYSITTHDGREVLVMFGNNGDKCSGIRRVRMSSREETSAEEGRVLKAAQAAAEQKTSANEAAPKSIDGTTKALYLQYIATPGKIETTSALAAIELVATRGYRDAAFRALMKDDFVRSCKEDKFGNVRRKLLALVAKVLERDAGSRWQRELKRPGDTAQAVVSPPAIDSRRSQLLAYVIEYGRKSGSSEIDAFVFAVRQAHHRRGKQFLLDVLHNPSDSDPFGKGDAVKGKWPENQGGSWRDARFHAAVGLAELGVEDGVRWLIEHARPKEFGLDDGVFYHPHSQVRSGSLRENCDYALRDITGTQGPRDWDKWWREKAATFTPRPVSLKP